jgi:hypothetical protein
MQQQINPCLFGHVFYTDSTVIILSQKHLHYYNEKIITHDKGCPLSANYFIKIIESSQFLASLLYIDSYFTKA